MPTLPDINTMQKRSAMKYFTLIALLVLANCAPEGRYPLSGEECGPDDPVLTLDANDCMPQLPM